MARCMLLDAGLPLKYWAEAVNTANYLHNRLPSRSVQQTPFELWWGEKPDVKHLQIFGTEAYVMVPKANRTKLEPTAQKLTFVGYSMQQKAYRFLNRQTSRIVNSRDARFLPTTIKPVQETDCEDGSTFDYPFRRITDDRKLNLFPIVTGDVHGEPEEDEEFFSEAEEEDDLNVTLSDVVSRGRERPRNATDRQPETPVRSSSRSTKGQPPQRYRDTSSLVSQQTLEPKTYAEAMASSEREQ